MTTGAHGGYQPPGDALTEPHVEPAYPTDPGYTGTGQQSTAQAAKEQAGSVASTAGDQAKNVAAEAKYQARNLANETQNQVRQQAGVQKGKAAEGLRSLSYELQSMSQSGAQSGVATDLARQASEKARDLAGWLETREPGDLVNELRDLARRKPGTFLLGAAAVGVIAGRLTRSAVDVKRDDSDSAPTTAGFGSPAPASTTGSEWVTATSPGADETLVVEEPAVVSPEPYATSGSGRPGGDRL